MNTASRSLLIASLFLSPLAAAQDAAPPAASTPSGTPAPAQPAATPPARTITNADELLAALETADKDLTTFESDLLYTKKPNELIGGSDEIRTGKLWFFSKPVSPEPNAPADAPAPQSQRLFQVEFLTLELDKVRRDDRQIWIFDGAWLVEKNFETRLLHRRQVVKPGEKVDPLAIGEGPLPIPIGQKREKIVERFDATLAPLGEGFPNNAAPASLTDTYQLHLKPKRGTQEARDFREVRIWYRTNDLLPRLARAVHKDGSTTEIFLTNMQVNKDLSETVFDTRLPVGWNEQVDDFRQAKNADE